MCLKGIVLMHSIVCVKGIALCNALCVRLYLYAIRCVSGYSCAEKSKTCAVKAARNISRILLSRVLHATSPILKPL